jgi:hypothetical protein
VRICLNGATLLFHHADRGETNFSSMLSVRRRQRTTTTKPKGLKYENPNDRKPVHPFKLRTGLSPGHLGSSPSAIRQTCADEKHDGGQMKEQKQKMKEDMDAQNTQLTEQLAKMNSAPEDKKMDRMASVITLMVEQRIAMDARKAKMDEEMMQHMMQHMQMGKESMSQCPMMKEMKGMDEKSMGAEKE